MCTDLAFEYLSNHSEPLRFISTRDCKHQVPASAIVAQNAEGSKRSALVILHHFIYSCCGGFAYCDRIAAAVKKFLTLYNPLYNLQAKGSITGYIRREQCHLQKKTESLSAYI